jgi:2-polyprenyl-3-methyl-5-hydroxy-6-metoxy-1,4-benzoquinol methylase
VAQPSVMSGSASVSLVMAFDARYLLAPFAKWDDRTERRAMRFIRGRVLDVGCGGGRVCLYLQDRGIEVVGIDSSPGAIECCRRRGVRDARLVAVDAVDSAFELFDTIVFLGQNFGMLGSQTRARRVLRRLAQITTPRGRSSPRRSTRTPSTIRFSGATASAIFVADACLDSYACASATATCRRRGWIGFSSRRTS